MYQIEIVQSAPEKGCAQQPDCSASRVMTVVYGRCCHRGPNDQEDAVHATLPPCDDREAPPKTEPAPRPGVHVAHVDARGGDESVLLALLGEAMKNYVLSSHLASLNSKEGSPMPAGLAGLVDLVPQRQHDHLQIRGDAQRAELAL